MPYLCTYPACLAAGCVDCNEAVPDPADDPADDSYDKCSRCHGDGMDPWNDYLLPCPLCQGEQRP